MRDELNRTEFSESLDRRLSGLQDDPWLTAKVLAKAEGEFTPSEFVRQTAGVDNVCERAAVLAAGPGGELIMKNVTAEEDFSIKRTTGDVTFELCDAAEIVYIDHPTQAGGVIFER